MAGRLRLPLSEEATMQRALQTVRIGVRLKWKYRAVLYKRL